MELINVEDLHSAQMKNIAVDSGNQSTWWDAISDQGQPLPRPPTGSLDVVARQGFTSYQYGKDSKWSSGKYEYALSSSRCLDTSIMFLISRVHYAALRDMPTISCIDAVAISKGICRCSDASRAIQDRLKALSRPEEDITKMLGASNVLNVSGSNQPLSKSLDVEREYLSQLGSSLGRCAEKMVCLALQEARRLLSGASSISQGDTRDQWAYFIVAMAPALDHTEIDTKGVGCVFDGEGADISKAMAQALRQELDKMKACMN
jgi:hypothetical protein